MRRLPSVILFLGLTVNLFAQNPHGSDLKMDCAACHTPAGWKISPEFWKKNDLKNLTISKTTGRKLPFETVRFNHDNTDFELLGQHSSVDCRSCHSTLVFSEASTDCMSCHVDIHSQTVGADCARCHSSENWLVDNITERHQENGFPLVGAHTIAGCFDCHNLEPQPRFDPIGNECANCHLGEFMATTHPNHLSAGFSTNCIECHDINGFDWSTENINHSFFPLTKGHEIEDCAKCHTNADYSNAPTDCISCHQTDFETSINPNHLNANFSTNCTDCHTTDPEWKPANYLQHDADHFPIHSGEHNGEWDQCVDCHTNPSNYAEFSCTTCHINPETDNRHNGIGGYSYNSQACLSCHPTGESDDTFDHNQTNFPLTGTHLSTDCIECHASGYAGTPTDCASCHMKDFNQTTNPNHSEVGISTDCASCHTTEADWNPATFSNHNAYYALNGAHAAIANDCATCHNGNYNNTSNTCAGCHLDDYNNTTNPNHSTAQLPTDCAACHSESAWQPSTFDHDAQYFPIYSGKHKDEWDQCVDCHIAPADFSIFSCIDCHQHGDKIKVDKDHSEVSGYSYSSMACYSCHPSGN